MIRFAEKVSTEKTTPEPESQGSHIQDRYVSAETQTDIPKPEPHMICPITREVMRDPVATADGHIYERSAIENWFSHGYQTSPITNLRLKNKELTPMHAIRSGNEDWIKTNYGDWDQYLEANGLEAETAVQPIRQAPESRSVVQPAARAEPAREAAPPEPQAERLRFYINLAAAAPTAFGAIMTGAHALSASMLVPDAMGRGLIQKMAAPELRGFFLAESIVFGIGLLIFVMGHLTAYLISRNRR